MCDARQRTLRLLDAYVAKLGPELTVPYSNQLNPPLWEVGHVAWFADYWIARNRQRQLGLSAEPDHARPTGRLGQADAWYNSSQVAHASRWGLALPDLAATRAYLADSLAETLALLQDPHPTAQTDAGLYFFRLALFHEDMHTEAAIYMAQALDIAVPHDLMPASPAAPAVVDLPVGAQNWTLGSGATGFSFDNELAAHTVPVAAFLIDSRTVTWERYVPFIEATGSKPPRYLRRHGAQWQSCEAGQWQPVQWDAPVKHLTWLEAEQWCRWAGRRLPTEVEWEVAAHTQPSFQWGDVWEWTASPFLPFPGFTPHPYRDYSAPWFGDRWVLRGASRATTARMAHPKYRNFFTPERNDIFSGFRSCALSGL